jgi:SAM-dependent MidA family methyltransferase
VDVEIPEASLTGLLKQQISDSIYVGEDLSGNVVPVIPFNQYMKLCLYHPAYGYYRVGSSRVGREGDFYTSAYIGEVMGEQLASRLASLASERFPHDIPVEVIDWGGGTGRLSRQMLDAWTQGGGVGSRFSISVVEGNPGHRRAAEQTLEPYISSGKARVLSEEQAAMAGWRGKNVIVVANELLDAFPVHRIILRGGRLQEWGVGWSEGTFIPCLMELSSPRLSEWVKQQGLSLLENQTIEVNLDAADWVSELGSSLGNAILVLIDYGDEIQELSAPYRMDGTLLCYHKHRAHNDPYLMPGEQDLTSHVNFTHIRETAVRAGWGPIWYGTQKKFLVESGIMEKLSSHSITDPFHPIVRRNRSIRQLLLSDGMSELFKVQIFVKSNS